MEVRAVRSHEAPSRHSLILVPGDQVEIGERSTEWPAFVFVTAGPGEGWVPERHFTAERPVAVTIERYDTVELPVSAGELLTVTARDDESGWWWCQDQSGLAGWVPVDVLEIA